MNEIQRLDKRVLADLVDTIAQRIRADAGAALAEGEPVRPADLAGVGAGFWRTAGVGAYPAIFVGLAPELMVFERLAFSFFFGFPANFTERLTRRPDGWNDTPYGMDDQNDTTYVVNFGTTGAAASLVQGLRSRWYF